MIKLSTALFTYHPEAKTFVAQSGDLPDPFYTKDGLWLVSEKTGKEEFCQTVGARHKVHDGATGPSQLDQDILYWEFHHPEFRVQVRNSNIGKMTVNDWGLLFNKSEAVQAILPEILDSIDEDDLFT